MTTLGLTPSALFVPHPRNARHCRHRPSTTVAQVNRAKKLPVAVGMSLSCISSPNEQVICLSMPRAGGEVRRADLKKRNLPVRWKDPPPAFEGSAMITNSASCFASGSSSGAVSIPSCPSNVPFSAPDLRPAPTLYLIENQPKRSTLDHPRRGGDRAVSKSKSSQLTRARIRGSRMRQSRPIRKCRWYCP